MNSPRIKFGSSAFVALLMLLFPQSVPAHGGVVEEDDLCVIKIGYLRAHFKIYVPGRTGHRQYCEDIPVTGEAVFVMEYEHERLNTAAIDFRIIENVTGLGRFARLEHVEAIDNLEAVTVRYEPPAVVPDVFTLLHSFDESGEYIGIVSATDSKTGKVYTAVFPFEAGHTSYGPWPWIAAALVLLQLNFWLLWRRRKGTAASLVIVAAAMLPAELPAEQAYASDAGHFIVRYAAGIEPIGINRIHDWVVEVRSADGEPVDGATITVEGGMPAHDHGLPTAPRVVAGLGDGRYRIGGFRFHMDGYWEIELSIDDGAHEDVVTIPLEL